MQQILVGHTDIGIYLSRWVVFCYGDVSLVKTWREVDFNEICRFPLKQRGIALGFSLISGSFVCVFSGFMPESTGNLQISVKSTDSCLKIHGFHCLLKGRHSEAAHEKRFLWGRVGWVCHEGVGWGVSCRGGVGWGVSCRGGVGCVM